MPIVYLHPEDLAHRWHEELEKNGFSRAHVRRLTPPGPVRLGSSPQGPVVGVAFDRPERLEQSGPRKLK